MNVSNRKQVRNRILAVISVTIMLTIVGSLFGMNWSTPVEAGATLPPREKPAPRPDDGDDDSDTPLGAYIELRVQPVPPGAWSVVQWQAEGSAGGWHNVEGWHGDLGVDGFECWWVAAKDFNTGPFRWVVTQGPGGAELGVSQPFNLPAGANQVLQVEVLIN